MTLRRRTLLYLGAVVVAVAAGLAVGAYYLVRGNNHSESLGGGELLLFGSLVHGHVIYGVRPDGTHLRRLTRTGSYQFAVSPDGKRIAFMRTRKPPGRGRQPSALFVFDIGSGRVRRVTAWKATGTYRNPRWALGGRRIVFAECRPFLSECGLWSMRPNGSRARNLTGSLRTNGFAVISPDGRDLAFSTSLFSPSFPTPGNLYVARIDGSHRRLLATGVQGPPFSWSPRGLIAFDAGGITAVSLSGRIHGYPGLPRNASRPVWSPDGTRLAFERPDGGVYVAASSSRAPYRVSRASRSAWFGAWSPDGRRIAYTEHRIHGHKTIVVATIGDGHGKRVIRFRRPAWVVAWRPG
jgi:Tol biopolymer transport system component